MVLDQFIFEKDIENGYTWKGKCAIVQIESKLSPQPLSVLYFSSNEFYMYMYDEYQVDTINIAHYYCSSNSVRCKYALPIVSLNIELCVWKLKMNYLFFYFCNSILIDSHFHERVWDNEKKKYPLYTIWLITNPSFNRAKLILY